MNFPSPLRSAALVPIVVVFASCIGTKSSADEIPCAVETLAAPPVTFVIEQPAEPSWIFRRGTYTHDPYTGARVAQYMRKPPVEPLDDERAVTSRYRRSRTVLRGIDGSTDTYYEVQAWGNGRGGLDAEWERFHDAWKESYLSGGYYNQNPWGHGNGGPGYGGFPGGHGPGYGHGYPGYGFPGYGHGGPGYGHHPHHGHGRP